MAHFVLLLKDMNIIRCVTRDWTNVFANKYNTIKKSGTPTKQIGEKTYTTLYAC